MSNFYDWQALRAVLCGMGSWLASITIGIKDQQVAPASNVRSENRLDTLKKYEVLGY